MIFPLVVLPPLVPIVGVVAATVGVLGLILHTMDLNEAQRQQEKAHENDENYYW